MEELKMISIERLIHHPDNPRKDIGDIAELTESIKKNGIMQNLTVIPKQDQFGDQYWVLIGNRRFEAAKAAGLRELPCKVVDDLSPAEQVGIMLEENMQRNDLTIIEQAEGFQLMLDFGESVESIAERTGFSETTVRRRLKINELDKKTLSEKAEAFQLTISDMTELEKVKDVGERNSLLRIASSQSDLQYRIKSVIRRQKTDEWINKVKEKLKELGIPENKSALNELWSTKWEAVKRYSDETPLEEIDFKLEPEMFFCIRYNEFYIIKRTKAEKEVETPEDRARKETEKRKKQIEAIKGAIKKEFKEFLTEKFRETGILKYKMRFEPLETRTAWEIMCGGSYASIYKSRLIEPLCPSGWHSLKEEERIKANSQLRHVPIEIQMAWVTVDGLTDTIVDHNGEYCEIVGKRYGRLYDLLCVWGFRFSTENEEEFESVINGESELYVRKEKQEEKK
jgi:ParB family chromosome partitioning protein